MTYDKEKRTIECTDREIGMVENMFKYSLDCKVDWAITITKTSTGKKVRLIRCADKQEWY